VSLIVILYLSLFTQGKGWEKYGYRRQSLGSSTINGVRGVWG